MDMTQLQTIWREHLSPAETEQMDHMMQKERERLFGGELSFGTAGIRAPMAPGPAGINRFTIARTAFGIAGWLSESGLEKTCVIACDSRHNSRAFSHLCARILAQEGIRVFLFDRPAPTPLLAFAVRYLSGSLGIVISASHNPPEDNGLKCFDTKGAQLGAEISEQILKSIHRIPWFLLPQDSLEELENAGLILPVASSVWQAYYEQVLNQIENPTHIRGLKVVYTPLCGTGGEPMRTVLERLGAQVHMPQSEALPSGEFATCPRPNPEEGASFAQAFLLAERIGPDVILATDPDADRLAAAVPTENGFYQLSGNELGCLLMDYFLQTQTQISRPVVISSVVSTPLASVIAEHYGCRIQTVLTGFKHIGSAIDNLEQNGDETQFLFGFEESCGFLKGSYIRDKDGILAGALVCELAAVCRRAGMTLLDRWQELQSRFGYCLTELETVDLQDCRQKRQWEGAVNTLRSSPPEKIGDRIVRQTADYLAGVIRKRGEIQPTGLPAESMVGLWTRTGGRVLIRPSGTEPKLKLYFSALAARQEEARAEIEVLKQAVYQLAEREAEQ